MIPFAEIVRGRSRPSGKLPFASVSGRKPPNAKKRTARPGATGAAALWGTVGLTARTAASRLLENDLFDQSCRIVAGGLAAARAEAPGFKQLRVPGLDTFTVGVLAAVTQLKATVEAEVIVILTVRIVALRADDVLVHLIHLLSKG